MIDENAIKEIQSRVQKATVAAAKAEADEEHARKVVKDIRDSLSSNYGVSTSQEIKDKIKELEEEYYRLLAEAEEALDVAES